MCLPCSQLAMESLCFGCLPLVFDKLLGKEGEDKSIVVVVTPLTAIMKDQVSANSSRAVIVAIAENLGYDGLPRV